MDSAFLRQSLLSIAIGTIASQAIAAEKPTLTVYTYDSFVSEWGPGPQLKSAFEANCGCELEFVAVEDGVSILNRARIEGENTKADVLLGLDNGLIEETASLGLVQQHSVDNAQLTADLGWDNTQFLPFDYGYFAFVYDSKKVTTPAKSLDELIKSDAKVVYQDPRTSTPGQGLMTWLNKVYGDKTTDAWTQLNSHTVTVTKGWWEAYSLFLEGGADYVLSYTTSPAYHIVAEENDQYKAAEFSEGHVAQVEVAAISSYSDQVALANQFLAFLVSKEAQAILPVTNWMLPVIDGVELPAAFSTLVTPKQITASPSEIASARASWIRDWRNATAN
ncbi:thiamine ABC transporter substrate binding subunit [Marinobacterium sp. LSUCC0821]|uniref:thiamine ABC transporter substrate binding subunit n=1 Tax=Marinobacterium sp. LSUCC0821 TaxID=2668067 RepID=UPI0014527D9B|nr:thiamine ABC transporter substrate binding subunit [Marinobacterium sp. LSUCC0821]QJD70812.1 thiamine ABC transporter substrate binding subunit [Marinobacterium sp. LSUCC0821]